MRWRGRTLQRSIGWRFAAAALVSVVVLGGAVLFWIARVETEQAGVANRLLARAVRAEVEGFLARPLFALRQLAALAEASRDRPAVVQSALEALQQALPHVEAVFLLDAGGSIRQVALAAHNRGHPEDYLGLDRSRERFYREAVAARGPCWSDVFFSFLDGHRSMSLSVPAGDGLLVCTFSIEALELATADVGSQAVAYVLDRRGVLLLHPDASLASQNLNLRHLTPVAESLQGRETTHLYEWQGVEYLGSAARLPDSGWTVLVSQPLSVALAPVRQVLSLFFGGAGLVALAALATAGLVARRVVRPLKRLQDQVRGVARGQYRVELPPQQYREVEALAAGFRTMAAAVDARERELVASRERFQQLFNGNNDAILVQPLDADGRPGPLVEVNQMSCTLLGYARSELLALRPEEVLSAEDRSRFAEALGRSLEEDAPRVELNLLSACGEAVPVEVKVHRFQLDGQPTVMSVARDIRERRALEERLRQAQKLEAVGTLAGGIAHDFNNILGAIMGFTELTLLDLPPDSPDHGNLSEVLRASHRAKDIVKQILAFSRGAGESRRPVEPRLIAREALALLRASIPTTIEIGSQLARDAGQVLADPSQLHQVIVNLVTNAYQAMRTTGGVLTVELRAATDADGVEWVELAVSDNGPGIPETVQERIFEPYFTTKETGEGSGLGLAMVHGIVTGHGGTVAVHSVPGEGSTFTVRLPRYRGEEESSAEAVEGAVPRGTQRVLLVDDEDTLVRLGTRMMESLGYRVTACTDPRRALELVRADPGGFDLLLTDQTMPGLTGAELAREALAVRPDLPVLICTGYSETLDRATALANGARDLLTKPLNLRALADALRRAMDGAEEPTA